MISGSPSAFVPPVRITAGIRSGQLPNPFSLLLTDPQLSFILIPESVKVQNQKVSPAFSKAAGSMGQSPWSLSAESETLRVVRRAQPSDILMLQPDSVRNQAILIHRKNFPEM